MLVVFKHLVVSRFFQDYNAPVHYSLHSGKLDKVFELSLACIVAGCQHYQKHLESYQAFACKKNIPNVKTRGDLIACVLEC